MNSKIYGDTYKVVAIVQARMGSSRLPGKMLSILADRPLIDHVLERLMFALTPEGPLEDILVATSGSKADDPLVSHIITSWPSVKLIRGQEDDVLGRFLKALDEVPADAVVRVTGDCPLINIENLKHMTSAHLEAGADITNYRPGFEYVDKGVEVVSASGLKKAAMDPDLTARDREHVTTIMYRHPERYFVNYIDSKDYLRRADIRLSVDTEADLRFLRALCQGLGKSPVQIDLQEAIDYLDKHPELIAINSLSGRKSTSHERVRMGFRCDGGPGIGLGHVVGCLRLARLAAMRLGIGVEFFVREDKTAIDLIRQAGFALEVMPEDISPDQDIARLIAKTEESDWSAVVVNFCKHDIYRYAHIFHCIKDAGIPLIFMDNPVYPSYKLGDLVINALPHPDYPGYKPSDHPACYDGLAYFMLDEAFEPYRGCMRTVSGSIGRILVAMGGGDKENITGVVLEGIACANFRGYVDVVLGAANPHGSVVQEKFVHLGLNGKINCCIKDMPERMWAADLGFSALGLTTYEMAFMGLPTLLITGSPLNAEAANRYTEQYGGGIHLGIYPEVKPEDIAACLNDMIKGPAALQSMSDKQRKAVDGLGASRIINLIKALVNRQKAGFAAKPFY